MLQSIGYIVVVRELWQLNANLNVVHYIKVSYFDCSACLDRFGQMDIVHLENSQWYIYMGEELVIQLHQPIRRH